MEELNLTTLPWMRPASCAPCKKGGKGGGRDKVELMRIAASYMGRILSTEESALRAGLLQSLDPRARLAGAFLLIVAGALTTSAILLAVLFAVMVFLSAASAIKIKEMAGRVLPVAAFSLFFIAPSLFLIKGAPGYPAVTFSADGIRGNLYPAIFFFARAILMASFASAAFLSTRQADLFRAIRSLPLPDFFAGAFFLAFRHIFVLIKTVEETALARKARLLGPAKTKEARGWAASRMAYMMSRSLKTASEVEMAMASRGFTGKLAPLALSSLGSRDYVFLGAGFFFAILSALV